jgi:hypothetical protein
VRREFSGLPVYVGVEDGYVYVKRTAPMDKRQFRKYLEMCRRLGFRFDKGSSRWRARPFFNSPVDGLLHVLGRSL